MGHVHAVAIPASEAVTTTAQVAFTAAALCAVIDWVAVARKDRRLEYVFKPAVMVALIIAATTLDPTNGTRRWAFVIALAFSMLGDIFLMLPSDRFVQGVGAFAIAHIAYIVGLRIGADWGAGIAIGAVFVVAVALTAGRRIVVAAREKEPELATPVSAYIAIICVMGASAIATRNPLAALGAAIFMASDTIIAWNRFIQPFVWAPVTIMVTYHVGQALLVASLVRR